MSTLKFPEFDDIPVSTKTFIVATNLNLFLDKLRPPFVNTTEYVVIPKRRGRKKKVTVEDPNLNIPEGSIITIEYKGCLWGVDLKKKIKKCNECDEKALFGWPNATAKNAVIKCPTHAQDGMIKVTAKTKYFRNAATVVMIIDGKKVNFKLTSNGKFQITGCKFDSHAEKIIQYMWEHIKPHKDLYEMNGDKLSAIYIPAMRNIDFPLGFLVNREKLDMYINTETEYTSLLETSFGYTGVNIKLPITKPITSLVLKKFTYNDDMSILQSEISYNDYLDTLSEKERLKKLRKNRNTTFLVFHSGKIIASCSDARFCKDNYNIFIDIIRRCEHLIRERLD